MASRKYAALPDLDSAPDIYETPELTDDQSTVPPTTARSPSDNEFEEDDEDETGISRSRLHIDQARSLFTPAHVDARDVDFSDRVNGKRKSYKTSSRRQRILDDGTEEFGDISDDDETEPLARKIARLRREIEEAKEEYGKQKADTKQSDPDNLDQDEELTSLSQALGEISRFSDANVVRPAKQSAVRSTEPASVAKEGAASAPGTSSTYTITYAPAYEQAHALAKAADFDRRLVLLEKALGIGSSAMPELDSKGLPRAVLPALDTLHKQISTLSQASTSSLDSISRRVRTLIQEADNLEKSRKNAKAAQEALASTGSGAAVEGATSEDSEQASKINALYGTLPTIESLAPLLPPLLDRLRSLRVVHADAATAGETLDRIEKRQADMAADIQQWSGALEKLEAGIQGGESTMAENMQVMEGWVKGLEEKIAKMA